MTWDKDKPDGSDKMKDSDDNLRANFAAIEEKLGALTASTELTISSGAITISRRMHTVDTEGEIASDDLDTINGGNEGQTVILRAANDARTVVIKHNTGNIWFKNKSDLNLDDLQDGLMLFYDGTKWSDVGVGGLQNIIEDTTPQLGGDLDAQTRRIYDVKVLDFKSPTELTIATGAITVTQSFHTVDTESDAGSDDLDTINGGSTGRIVILRAENDGRTVVVKHNTGNIWLKGKTDISLDDIQDSLALIYDGTKWIDLGVAGGYASAAQWGYLGGSSGIDHFVDRGDPASDDFVVGDFTTDGNWHDLDLSSIVPAGTIAVLLRVTLADDAVGSYFRARRNGNANALAALIQYTQVVNNPIGVQLIIACDSNRVIEYQATNTTWSTISATVCGWWIP